MSKKTKLQEFSNIPLQDNPRPSITNSLWFGILESFGGSGVWGCLGYAKQGYVEVLLEKPHRLLPFPKLINSSGWLVGRWVTFQGRWLFNFSQGIVGCTPIPTYPYGKSLWLSPIYPYSSWMFMGYYPQESLYFRPISTMVVHVRERGTPNPIVPWFRWGTQQIMYSPWRSTTMNPTRRDFEDSGVHSLAPHLGTENTSSLATLLSSPNITG